MIYSTKNTQDFISDHKTSSTLGVLCWLYTCWITCVHFCWVSLYNVSRSHTFMSWVISCATRVLLIFYSFLCFCSVTWAHLLCEAATTDFLLGYCVSRQAHTHKSMMTLLQLIGRYLKYYPVKPLESARYIGFNLLKECSYPPQPSCATGSASPHVLLSCSSLHHWAPQESVH